MSRFENKTVLITGGNSGIGLAAAQAFAVEGAHVIITGRDKASLEEASNLIGKDAIALRNDASDLSEIKALTETLGNKGITLDAVFINAGLAKLLPFTKVDEKLWDTIFDTNVKGAYFQIQALLPF